MPTHSAMEDEMDPIKVRERLRAAWIELREAEVAVDNVARAVNEGAAEGWTQDQRASAFVIIVQHAARLEKFAPNAKLADVLESARRRLIKLAEEGR